MLSANENLKLMGSEPGTTPTSNRCAFRTLIVIVGILALANVVLVILLVTTLAGSNDQNKPFTNTACATQCAPLCVVESDSSCFKGCYHSCDAHMQFVRPAALSEWILPNAIQHTGITTSNLTRSYLFYTEILGGVEVLNAGGDGWKGDSVYQLLMQKALLAGSPASQYAANLSTAGSESLSARYVSFGSMVIELLDYFTASEVRLQERLNGGQADGKFPKWSPSNVAPSVVGNMHLSFNVRPDKNLDKFVTTLEETAHKYGFQEVYCNRLVPVKLNSRGQPDVVGVPLQDNSFTVETGPFQGWSLAYCKGPDGEQLEFNQVVGKAAGVFDQARATYLSGGTNKYWR